MAFTVSVLNTGIQFDCQEEETVLDAAERAGYSIPYSCRKGVCSNCEGELVGGKTLSRGREVSIGPASDVRLCQASPKSDIVIHPTSIQKVEAPAREVLVTKVHNIQRPATNVTIIKLRFPNGKRAGFRAGQYLQLHLPNGQTRNYSMANPPQQNTGVELHIRQVKGGAFSERILSTLEKGSLLTAELPFGQFGFDADHADISILLATGTGFAPIRSIVEAQIRSDGSQPMHLYWGGQSSNDLYESEQVEKWASQYDWLRYTPVLSQPHNLWAGRTGYVQDAALCDYPDMTKIRVYACGSQAMVNSARAVLTGSAGLPDEHFYCEAFIPTGEFEAHSAVSE